MIELINVSKYYQTSVGRHYVLRDVSLTIPRNLNVAIIGANGSGKSTTIRLIAGVDTPNSGKIVREGRISWPLGLTPSVQQSLNGYENARFACRIYGMPNDEIRETIEKVREITDIGKYFDLPVSTYSAGMRQRLSFAISISLDFDYYLFDEIGAGGDRRFKKLANELIGKRLSTSNFIMVSHAPSDVLDLCQVAILLRDGAALYFDDVRSALVEYGEEEFIVKSDRRAKAKARTEKRLASKKASGEVQDTASSADSPSSIASPEKLARRKRRRRKKVREINRTMRLLAKSEEAAVSPGSAVPKRSRRSRAPETMSEPLVAAESDSAAEKSGLPIGRAQRAAVRRARRRQRQQVLAGNSNISSEAAGRKSRFGQEVRLAPSSQESEFPALQTAKRRRKKRRRRQTAESAANTLPHSLPDASRHLPPPQVKHGIPPAQTAAGATAKRSDVPANTSTATKISSLAENWSLRGKSSLHQPTTSRK